MHDPVPMAELGDDLQFLSFVGEEFAANGWAVTFLDRGVSEPMKPFGKGDVGPSMRIILLHATRPDDQFLCTFALEEGAADWTLLNARWARRDAQSNALPGNEGFLFAVGATFRNLAPLSLLSLGASCPPDVILAWSQRRRIPPAFH